MWKDVTNVTLGDHFPKGFRPVASLDEPLPEMGSSQMWQELESLSVGLRAEALSDGRTVVDVLNKLPEIRREVFEELYGRDQVEAWEKEWKDGE